MKYIKMICVACNGMGWIWSTTGTTEEHMRMKGCMGGTDHIECNYCSGTGIHNAEIVEEED